MAPEMMKMMKYDEKVDIFSFGIVLCEVGQDSSIDSSNKTLIFFISPSDHWSSACRSRFLTTNI